MDSTTKRLTTHAAARIAGCHPNSIKNLISRGLLDALTLSDGTRALSADDAVLARKLIAEGRARRGRKKAPA
ncbi:MAG: hypothetical protein ACREXJ_15840 [Gammaproteobacteria bacterium]